MRIAELKSNFVLQSAARNPFVEFRCGSKSPCLGILGARVAQERSEERGPARSPSVKGFKRVLLFLMSALTRTKTLHFLVPTATKTATDF